MAVRVGDPGSALLPHYWALDARFVLFVYFPAAIGAIVGDMGYGAVLLGTVLWLRFRFREDHAARTATSILGPSAAAVFLFGVAYGELFGSLFRTQVGSALSAVSAGFLPLIGAQSDVLSGLMLLAAAIAFVNLLVALIAGVVGAVRTRSAKHVFENGDVIASVLAIGLVAMVAVASNAFENWGIGLQLTYAMVVLAGFLYAVRGRGLMTTLETNEGFRSVAGHVRVAAVALMGALSAVAITEILTAMAASPRALVMSVLVGIVLHTLNFVVAGSLAPRTQVPGMR